MAYHVCIVAGKKEPFMSQTKVRDTSPPARSPETLETERLYYAHYAKRSSIHTPISLPLAAARTSGPGASSSIMAPIVHKTVTMPAVLAKTSQHPSVLAKTSRHPNVLARTALHPGVMTQRAAAIRLRYRPQNAPKRVDGEAAVATFGMLALYVVLIGILIAMAAKPSPVHKSDETAGKRPIAVTTPAPVAVVPVQAAPLPPSLPPETAKLAEAVKPIQTAKPTVAAPVEAAPRAKLVPLVPELNEKAAAATAAARREKALDLLRKARESQNDAVTYRQMLAELVRTYSDTPAGAEALNLLTAEPAVQNAPAAAREEAPEVKANEEKNVPTGRYGLGLMN
jgi:hypothetical protein